MTDFFLLDNRRPCHDRLFERVRARTSRFRISRPVFSRCRRRRRRYNIPIAANSPSAHFFWVCEPTYATRDAQRRDRPPRGLTITSRLELRFNVSIVVDSRASPPFPISPRAVHRRGRDTASRLRVLCLHARTNRAQPDDERARGSEFQAGERPALECRYFPADSAKHTAYLTSVHTHTHTRTPTLYVHTYRRHPRAERDTTTYKLYVKR